MNQFHVIGGRASSNQRVNQRQTPFGRAPQINSGPHRVRVQRQKAAKFLSVEHPNPFRLVRIGHEFRQAPFQFRPRGRTQQSLFLTISENLRNNFRSGFIQKMGQHSGGIEQMGHGFLEFRIPFLLKGLQRMTRRCFQIFFSGTAQFCRQLGSIGQNPANNLIGSKPLPPLKASS